MPTSLIFFSLIILTYLVYSGNFLFEIINLEINQMICALLITCLGFFICLDIIYIVVLNGDKLKKDYPSVYKCLIIGLFFCLITLSIFFLFNLKELCFKIISLIIKNIGDFIVKMLTNPRSNPGSSGPGGFGEPVGGGGKPPKKPGGFEPSKGHYDDKDNKPKIKRKWIRRTEEQKEKRNASEKKRRLSRTEEQKKLDNQKKKIRYASRPEMVREYESENNAERRKERREDPTTLAHMRELDRKNAAKYFLAKKKEKKD